MKVLLPSLSTLITIRKPIADSVANVTRFIVI